MEGLLSLGPTPSSLGCRIDLCWGIICPCFNYEGVRVIRRFLSNMAGYFLNHKVVCRLCVATTTRGFISVIKST